MLLSGCSEAKQTTTAGTVDAEISDESNVGKYDSHTPDSGDHTFFAKPDCLTCDGSGDCQTCGGDGYKVIEDAKGGCNTCKGSGKCRSCGGSGKR